MATNNIYSDIATRTGGDIYIGVVGPVRTGKSTFIKKSKIRAKRSDFLTMIKYYILQVQPERVP